MSVGSGEARQGLRGAPRGVLAAICLFGVFTACRNQPPPAAAISTTLKVGYGLTTGQNPELGMRQQLTLMEREALVFVGRDGRLQPWLADRWTVMPDGLRWQVHLREDVTFHDGQPMTAEAVAAYLTERLPRLPDPPAKDIEQVRALSRYELEFVLKRRSTFLLEGLELPIEAPVSGAGTGPFTSRGAAGPSELIAYPNYYGGKPFVDRIVLTPYESIRAAWADMLRGNVDMLYEVGTDALDSLEPASTVKVFTQQRSYSYLISLNVQRRQLASSEVRRALNAAIDRPALVAEALKGHGAPADRPVWPAHWAADQGLPHFEYAPKPLRNRLVFTCLFADASLERVAVVAQRQLAAIGVDMKLELVTIDDWIKRVEAGNFDAVLADATQGPPLVRPSRFWRTGGPFNWGHYSNARVDEALDGMRAADTDDAYRTAVAGFHRAMVDDPPAIFLAWSERARAVSTRFDVPVEPGRDILSTLRLWKPIAPAPNTTN